MIREGYPCSSQVNISKKCVQMHISITFPKCVISNMSVLSVLKYALSFTCVCRPIVSSGISGQSPWVYCCIDVVLVLALLPLPPPAPLLLLVLLLLLLLLFLLLFLLLLLLRLLGVHALDHGGGRSHCANNASFFALQARKRRNFFSESFP